MVEFKVDDAIYVKNFDAIIARLKDMDAKLAKRFRRELKQAVRPVQRKAQSFVPQQVFPGWRDTKPYYPPAWGWATDTAHRGRTYGKTGESRWQWSRDEAVRGIFITEAKTKVQRIKGVEFGVSALSLQSKSVPGIIYELAGFGTARSKGRTRRVSRNQDASNLFIAKVGKADKPRLVYRAAYEMASQVHANLYGVLKKYLGENFRG
jgi:hypothetical protein